MTGAQDEPQTQWEISGNYALSWQANGLCVVAWVRASERQDWAPISGCEQPDLESAQAAARAACRAHWQAEQMKKQRRANGGTG